MIKASRFSGTGSELRQGDQIVVIYIYIKLCGLLDIDITMQCAVVESKSKSTRDQNSQNIFMIPKCFGVGQQKFRQQTNSEPILLETPRDQKQFHNYFMKKYKTLYNSVPTSDSDLSNIKNTLVKILHPSEVSNLDHVTPELICHCTGKLKPGKGDGSEGFRSDHLINAGKSLNVLLSLLFRAILLSMVIIPTIY